MGYVAKMEIFWGEIMTKEPEIESLIVGKSGPYRSILIFGPPGSGKGTVGKILSSAGNHFHLSSGDVFRGLAPESPAGKLYHSYASKGHLLPDAVTIGIWHYYVEGLIATNRYFPHQQLLLLDGIPRTKRQAELLDQHIKVMHLIVLEVDDANVLTQRLTRRGILEHRADDRDEAVLRTRMEVYQRDTVKVLEHYPKELISRFNGDQRPLEVLKDVLVKHSDLLTHTEESYI